MPAPNDLTREEEAMFGQHGVAPAGQGSEPVRDDNEAGQEGQQQDQEDQQQDDENFTQQDLARQQEAQSEPKPGEVGSRHRADGTFKNAEELEADRKTLTTQGQGQQGQEQQQSRMVPHEALHAERLRTQEFARRAQLATTRMNALLNQRQGGDQQAPQMPDLVNDPAGYIQALEARLSQFEQGRAEEAQFRQIDNALEQDEQMFEAQVPDYPQASEYYVQSRARELLQFYPPDQAKNIMMEEARNIAQQAWQRGMSAGQVVYGLAQARGYQVGQQQQGQGQSQQQNGGQQQGQGQRQSAASVVAGIRQGQGASRSLSGGAGGGRTGELNAEALLAMSDEEFEAHLGLGKKGASERFMQVG